MAGLFEQLELCRKQINCVRSAESILPVKEIPTASGIKRHPVDRTSNGQMATVSTPLQVRHLGAVPKQCPPNADESGKRQVFSLDEIKNDANFELNPFPTNNVINDLLEQQRIQARSYINPDEQLRHHPARLRIENMNPYTEKNPFSYP